MVSLTDELKSIKSIKTSRRSIDDRESTQSLALHMPTIKKKQKVTEILNKWERNQVKPFQFDFDVFQMLSSDLDDIKWLKGIAF